ncbi:MAG: hypothetical protein WD883_03235 [Candidatus Colwellbacteria bacterium]
MTFEKPEEMPQQDPLVVIEAIRNEMMQGGAVDVENSSLDEIISKLQKGELTPEQAIEAARFIQANRQDYH